MAAATAARVVQSLDRLMQATFQARSGTRDPLDHQSCASRQAIDSTGGKTKLYRLGHHPGQVADLDRYDLNPATSGMLGTQLDYALRNRHLVHAQTPR